VTIVPGGEEADLLPIEFRLITSAATARLFLLALRINHVQFARRDCGRMTNDILQSDIDLARRLLDAGRPADEIVATLGYRGINGTRAVQLVAELQAGKTVEPDKPIAIKLPSGTSEGSAVSAHQPGRSSAQGDLPERPQNSRSTQRKAHSFPWFTIIALVAAAVSVAAFVLLSRKSHTSDSNDQDRSQPSDQAATEGGVGEKGASVSDAKAISLQVEPQGLRLCGKSLARENFLPGIFKILGAPARTNQVEKADQVIYAYDACGLLVYAPKDAGHYSIVLDFDASDGTAGTKNPFVGTFKISNRVIRPGTDAASLGSVKELGLQPPNSASGIFHAQYGACELVFGYLKSSERLSLIEIDFK
jgi:hypothetical protein